MLPVGSGEVTVFAVVDEAVAAVPVSNDLQAAVYLSAQFRIGQVVTGEDRAHCPADPELSRLESSGEDLRNSGTY